MGLVLGPLSAPCVAPVIGTVLVAIAQEGRVVLGALQLFTFALGMGVLFMIVGLSSTLLPRSGPWLIKLKQAMGVVVLAFAAWNVRLVVPEWLNPAMWAVALLATAALLDAFKKPEGFAASISKGLGLLALALTILLGVRAVESGLRLELLPRASTSAAPKESLWMQQDFEGALARARSEHKLVLVDTYAEWCAQCKELDEKTWPEPRLREWIQRSAVAIRIDADKVRPDIATRFRISGFPTVLLLDEEGRELKRFVGFQGPAEMLAFLEGR
jgi:thiol:disulfide interchange protein DsbD